MTDGSSVPPTEAPADAILTILREIARDELNLPAVQLARLRLESPLVESLQADSLAQVVLLTRLEERLNIEFEMDDRDQMETSETIGDLVRLIQRRMNERESN